MHDLGLLFSKRQVLSPRGFGGMLYRESKISGLRNCESREGRIERVLLVFGGSAKFLSFFGVLYFLPPKIWGTRQVRARQTFLNLFYKLKKKNKTKGGNDVDPHSCQNSEGLPILF